MSKPLDREGFVFRWWYDGIGRRVDFCADLDALLAAELVAGVEWGIKHVSKREDWPLSWDAGFPGMKAQALIDRAAAIRAGKEGGG